jgi:N-methylhydantoinase A
MRYVGQEHAVTVNLPLALFRNRDRAGIKRHFDEVHAKRYGFNAPKDPAEIVSLYSSVVGRLEKPAPKKCIRGAGAGRVTAEVRKVFFAELGGFADTAVYLRGNLPAGTRIQGPALVEEYASTTVVYPGDELEVSEFGDLVVTIARG